MLFYLNKIRFNLFKLIVSKFLLIKCTFLPALKTCYIVYRVLIKTLEIKKKTVIELSYTIMNRFHWKNIKHKVKNVNIYSRNRL